MAFPWVAGEKLLAADMNKLPSWKHIETLTWSADATDKTTASFTAADLVMVVFYFTESRYINLAVNGIGANYYYRYVSGTGASSLSEAGSQAHWAVLSASGAGGNVAVGDVIINGRHSGGNKVAAARAFMHPYESYPMLHGALSANSADVTTVTVKVGSHSSTGKAMIFTLTF